MKKEPDSFKKGLSGFVYEMVVDRGEGTRYNENAKGVDLCVCFVSATQ